MITLLISWLIISVIFLSLGNIIIKTSNLFHREEINYGKFDIFFLGLCSAVIILNIWSIFLPTNFLSFLFLLLISLVYWAFSYKQLNQIVNSFKSFFTKLKYLIPFTLILVFVGLFAIIPPLFSDTYLYHIPAIKWYEQYKVVLGLANFHGRFGFNSSVLLLGTTFSFDFIFNKIIFSINSLSILVFMVWLMKNLIDKRGTLSIIALLIILGFFGYYSLSISTLSTDILPNILIAYLLLRFVFSDFEVDSLSLIYWVLPLCSVTMKLSSFSICLICLISLYGIVKNSNYKYLVFLVATSFIIIIPWIIRNILLTGYIAYPFPSIDIFNFDWKVPLDSVVNEKNWIYSWARLPGKSWNEVLPMGISEWFPQWWTAKEPVMRKLFLLCCFSPLFFGVQTFLSKKNRLQIILVGVTFFTGFLLWLFTAPDYRFAYGFIVISMVFPILMLDKLFNHFHRVIKIVTFVCLLYFGFDFAKSGINRIKSTVPNLSVSSLILTPPTYEVVQEYKDVKFEEHQLGNQTIYTSTNNCCFEKFPCTPYIQPNLELRGASPQEGFRVKKTLNN